MSRAAQTAPDPARDDRVMLIRNRKSRIYFLRQFFDYPIQLSGDTLQQAGAGCAPSKIGISYAHSMVHQMKPEKTLEQFLINRFGTRAVSDFLQVLYGESLGRPLRPDQRGVGRAAHQRPLDH